MGWGNKNYNRIRIRPFATRKNYSRTFADARIALVGAEGNWEAALWGENITDEEYLTYINNIAFFKLDIFGRPATYGLSFRYRFE